MTCKVVHAGILSDGFAVKTGGGTRLRDVTILIPAGDRLDSEGDNKYTTNRHPVEPTETA